MCVRILVTVRVRDQGCVKCACVEINVRKGGGYGSDPIGFSSQGIKITYTHAVHNTQAPATRTNGGTTYSLGLTQCLVILLFDAKLRQLYLALTPSRIYH